MSYSRTIIIGVLLIFSAQHSSAASGQYDFGIISRDTTFAWSAQLPMYTPSTPGDEVDCSNLPNVFPNGVNNYIYACEPTSPSSSMGWDASSNIVNRFYYDAFGRKVETVMTSFSPMERDVAILQGYDHYGRESECWKAAEFVWDDACANGYVYPDDIQKEAIDFYNDSCPYSRKVYEHSPLARACGELSMGRNWRKNDRNKSVQYLFSEDKLTCIRWEENGDVFCNKGTYKAGDISILKYTDEDGNITYEFIDGEGRKILRRRQCQGIDHDTYYIYDRVGNLRYILPPAFSTYPSFLDEESKEMKDLAYMYVYDDRKRCVKKKLPGCEWACNIYDLGDNLVFTQDGELRKRGEWRFCIYDKNKRPCLEGVCKNHFDINEISELDVSATYTGADFSGYRVDGVSLSTPSLLNANYYDDYSFLDTANEHGSANGLLTSSLTAVLGDESDSRYLTTAYYYDGKGRIVEQVSTNVMGGTDRSVNASIS